MIIRKMFKLIIKSLFIYFFIITHSIANEDFANWLKNFQSKAINSGISDRVVRDIMSNARFLPKVIE